MAVVSTVECWTSYDGCWLTCPQFRPEVEYGTEFIDSATGQTFWRRDNKVKCAEVDRCETLMAHLKKDGEK